MRARRGCAHERARLYMPPYLGFSVRGLLAFHEREGGIFPVKSLGVIKWLLLVGPPSGAPEMGGGDWPQRPNVFVVMQQFFFRLG